MYTDVTSQNTAFFVVTAVKPQIILNQISGLKAEERTPDFKIVKQKC
jgi:hypothetical protein